MMKSWIKIEDQYTCPCCASEFDAKQLHMKVFCNCPACAMPLLASMDREAQYVQMNSLNNITMKEYGYDWAGMVPLSTEEARKFWNSGQRQLYVLYPDGTRSAVLSQEALEVHIMCHGIFGVEKNPAKPAASLDGQYVVFIVHSYAEDTSAYAFNSEDEARDYFVSAFFEFLSTEVKESSQLNQNSCFINVEEGYASVAWNDGEHTDFRMTFVSSPEKQIAKLGTPELLYELYKLNWCKERGWNYSDVREAELRDKEYEGQMYSCIDEFVDCEYEIPGYADSLLSDIDLIRTYLSMQ